MQSQYILVAPDLPGPMAEGNQAVDQLISFLLLRILKILLPFFNRPYKATLYYTRVLTCYTIPNLDLRPVQTYY
jgi:hypothetical protein